MRAPRKKSGRRAAATLSARLLSHVTLQAQAGGDIAALFDDVSLGLGKFSAATAERAKDLRVGLPLSAFASGSGKPIKKSLSSSGDWRGAVSSSIASGAREARIWSSSSLSCRIIGRACRTWTMLIRWCCHGSPTCGGAPTRWFWNCRAPAPCSKFAIPGLRLPWRAGHAATDQTIPPAKGFFGA